MRKNAIKRSIVWEYFAPLNGRKQDKKQRFLKCYKVLKFNPQRDEKGEPRIMEKKHQKIRNYFLNKCNGVLEDDINAIEEDIRDVIVKSLNIIQT